MLAIEDANIFGADLVIAVSKASKDELVSRGVPEGRVLVNPNGVDIERFGGDAGDLRATLNIAPDETVIGFVGTFGQWHGTDILAQAFARLLALRPEHRTRLRLLMIGDGNLRPAAEETLRRAGAADRAIFTGTVPQHAAPAYLAACDVLASPHVPNPDGTPFFGSPTKLFEYMAARRAIVASDLDQVGEVLRHEKTALLVRPGDPEALAGALMRAAADDALRARLGVNARAVCEANYTWTIHTRRILDALTAISDRGTLR
jgi:glycosyltransferase involved in cell wall biosynthesis